MQRIRWDRVALHADALKIVFHQREEAFALSAIEPYDCGQVEHLFGREVVYLPRNLPVNVARVEHQHLVAALNWLGAVEEPQLAWDGARVEEVGAD